MKRGECRCFPFRAISSESPRFAWLSLLSPWPKGQFQLGGEKNETRQEGCIYCSGCCGGPGNSMLDAYNQWSTNCRIGASIRRDAAGAAISVANGRHSTGATLPGLVVEPGTVSRGRSNDFSSAKQC